MAYLVIPGEGVGLHIDAVSLKSALERQWPNIEFDEDDFVLEWRILTEEDDIYGFLLSNKEIVSLDCFNGACAEFAVWYRSFIPDQYQLFLCHDQDAKMIIELRTGCTKAEIVKAIART